MLPDWYASYHEPLKGRLFVNQSLADYTSWRTGGVADYLYIPKDQNDLALFLKALPLDMPVTYLGLGSNTLIRDGGIEGVVIITQSALQSLKALDNGLIRAEAGVSAAQLARYTARMGLAGLEFMAGIPGTVGGALAMNAGCFGGETWPFVHSVEMINRKGDMIVRDRAQFEVAYRHVKRLPDEWFLAGYFQLSSGDKSVSLEKIRTLLERRNQTQPAGTANCGSVFRNPTGGFAGQLIETCGLKGMRLGGAVVSEKHANFIINEGHAKSNDIEQLIAKVKVTVEQETGIQLMTEVCIIGRT